MYITLLSVVFASSVLTLFSGFGLGTILLPAYALFFPLDIAIILTAIVHFMNNIFKLVLLGKHADKKVVFAFGLPAIVSAFAGAWVLFWLDRIPALYRYEINHHQFSVTTVKVVIAFLMVVFVLLETLPQYKQITFGRRHLPVGGVLSGFFGGLSGHQGALRSAFLVKCGLSQEGFIATGVVIACLVDFSRLSVYSTHFSREVIQQNFLILIASIIAAYAGVVIGRRFIKKVTLPAIQRLVSAMLFIIALCLGAGLI